MNRHRKRILIVDDDEDVRQLLGDLFEGEGYDVAEAGDGAEALVQMERKSYDVVLSDYHMPHMDGIAFLKASRMTWPDTPVILASCDPELAVGLGSKLQIAYACLSKPFDLDQLLHTVRDAARGEIRCGDVAIS